MSIALTFTGKEILDTPIVGPDGAVHYTTSSTHGFRGRKVTTITAASGLVGCINWREEVFVINGQEWSWSKVRSRSGFFKLSYEWHWNERSYKLEYHDMNKSLLATPTSGNVADTVQFHPYHPHLFHANERATILFPHQMQDEVERMFLLMAILQTDVQQQDAARAAAAHAAA
ncbi:hypothetical protein MSAN_00966100 [Mycena sanguinolenta]|uniref:DUF6593 domain-containing protein n=1 Tax=Mycena sanguinolenta TaxID=230812 RepID=A0A8H6YXK3_9AGAR|nr:hypothetical protein MSAN_00966100 [Mycena sanguinolenta]